MNPTALPALAARLTRSFPSAADVPPEFRLDPRGYERWCLLDGQLTTWDGAMTEVSSPLCLERGGTLSRPVIGHVPLMDEAAALKCFSIRSLVAAQATPESRELIREIVAGRHSSFLHTDYLL